MSGGREITYLAKTNIGFKAREEQEEILILEWSLFK